MKFLAEIDVMPLNLLLDPQGKAVEGVMKNTGFSEVSGVRIGKHITFEVEAPSLEEAKKQVDEACKQILCNATMESYKFNVRELE